MSCGETPNSIDRAESNERQRPARCKGCDGLCGCRQRNTFLQELPRLDLQRLRSAAAGKAEIKTEGAGGA